MNPGAYVTKVFKPALEAPRHPPRNALPNPSFSIDRLLVESTAETPYSLALLTADPVLVDGLLSPRERNSISAAVAEGTSPERMDFGAGLWLSCNKMTDHCASFCKKRRELSNFRSHA